MLFSRAPSTETAPSITAATRTRALESEPEHPDKSQAQPHVCHYSAGEMRQEAP